MRKRIVPIIVLFIICVLGITIVSYAEETNLANMPFEELYNLKLKVEYEFNSRVEANPFTLKEGVYLAGTDLAPGRYYISFVESKSGLYNPRLQVYADKSAYESNSKERSDLIYDEYFQFCVNPRSVVIEAGNYLFISNAPLLFSLKDFNPSDHIVFKMPEGTLVSAGIYFVGQNGDLPAGKYQIFAGTPTGGYLYVYSSKEDYESDKSSDPSKYNKKYFLENLSGASGGEGIILDEGNILLVKTDMVMRKQKSLLFD